MNGRRREREGKEKLFIFAQDPPPCEAGSGEVLDFTPLPFFSHENGLRENLYKVFFPPHFPRCILSRIQRRDDTKNPRTRPSSPPPFQRTQEETFRALFLDTHARHTHTCPNRGEREFTSAGVCRRRRPIADDDIAARSSYGTHTSTFFFSRHRRSPPSSPPHFPPLLPLPPPPQLGRTFKPFSSSFPLNFPLTSWLIRSTARAAAKTRKKIM